jgi:hypothetical protein
MLLHFVFRSKRHCGGIAEPIDEAHSKVAFLVSLPIEPAPTVMLALIGRDNGQDQSAQGGRPLVQDH